MRGYGITNAAPYATAPAVGVAGDTYFNTTSKVLYMSDGTTWLPGVSANTPAYGIRLRRSVDQGIAAGATNVVVMNTIMNEVNPGTSFYDGASGGIKIPAGAAGRYFLNAHCRWDPTATQAVLFIAVNGVSIVRASPDATIAYLEQNCTAAWTLAVGDVVTLQAWNQLSGVRTISGLVGGGTDPPGPVLEAWKIDAIGNVGATGPVGPDITQAQSSYFTTTAVQTNTIGTAYAITTWAGPASLNNGFTFPANGTNITVVNAGRYLVTTVYSIVTSGAVLNGSILIQQLNSALTVKVGREFVTGADINGAAWTNWAGQAMFDCVAGDIIRSSTSISAGTYNLDARSYITIVPVGGTKGDKGDPGANGTGTWA